MSTLVISNFQTGFETDREPFLIDNDAFPVLNNAYVWRGRVLRKRGNSFLGRLQRDLETVVVTGAYSTINGTNTFALFTALGLNVVEPDAAVRPGTLIVVFAAPIGQTLEDNNSNGILDVVGVGPIQSATINYNTGIISITANAAAGPADATITLSYYPALPVMGLESFDTSIINFPRLISFDTRYSYEIIQSTDTFYDVTFYRNTGLAFNWNGQNYQQFWTANYQGAMWATNGRSGFHFTTIELLANQGPILTITVTLGRADLIVGDVLFFDEVQGTTITNLNMRTGTITDATLAPIYQVTFTDLVTINAWTAMTGIAQLLTHSSNNVVAQDGIRWYDGDPTTATPPLVGWANFMPPLSTFRDSTDPFPNLHPDYLVGAKLIVPFKNRLLFGNVTIARYVSFGVYQFIDFPNRWVYSQVGTPYYTVSGLDPAPEPILVPVNQTADPFAWTNDAGRGGFIGAPISQAMVTVQENEDVLINEFESRKLKLIFTGDDTLPFIFQTINSELGAQSTFSSINLDTGSLAIGEYGLTLTTQVSAQRIDLKIPDQVFDIRRNNNDDARVTAVRDYRNEWVYFTYCPNTRGLSSTNVPAVFPSKTLLYNYRDNTWATFDENYTTYGTFRRTVAITWADLGAKYGTWAGWNDPWNFGSTEQQYPNIVGGNQQGFVMIRDSGTYEARSQFIQAIDLSSPAIPSITSPDHGLYNNDFIEVFDVLGVTNMNDVIFKIQVVDRDTFILLLNDEQDENRPSGTYLGNGVYRRISKPFFQTKQFPIFWNEGRKARIGTQRFLFQTTDDGEITVNLFMSQADNFPVNIPASSDYLIASDIVLTHAEPNIGNAYPPDPNQMWHRLTNSFIGDTVQVGFTLSENQLRVNDINSAEIMLHAIAINLFPGPVLP